MSKESMQIGERIKETRLKNGMTQKALAELCGMYESQIRKYESGALRPKWETLHKIATALNVSIYWLSLGDEILTDKDLFPKKILNEDEISKYWAVYLETHGIDQRKLNKLLQSKKELTGWKNGEKKLESYRANELLLMSHFLSLNMDGQNKAIELLELLTKIPEYQDIELIKHVNTEP